MPRLPRFLATAGLVAAALACFAPILRGGSPIGHDSRHHLVWVAQFADSLAAGLLYPRWLPDVNMGLGNPTFVFYPPLLYYLAALGRWLTGSAPRGLDFADAVALAVSGAAAYRYLRTGLGRPAAWLGAVAAMALPYRLLNLYERAAVAEFAAMAWPPLALLALGPLVRAPSFRAAGPAAAGLAGATAGLALTHLPSLVLWGPIFALAAVWSARRAARGPAVRAAVVHCWLALALGLAAASVFLLPAIAERSLVQMEWLQWVARAEEHTIFSARMAHGSQMMAFNHKVGTLACWTGALALVAALAVLWPGGGRPWEGEEKAEAAPGARLPARPAVLVALVAFALMTGPSAPLWAALPILPWIQFPWRLLAVVSAAAALLVACAATRALAREAPAAARALALAALALLAWNLRLSADRIVGEAHLDTAAAARVAADARGAQDAAEYRPRGAPAAGFPRLPRAESLQPGGWARAEVWTPVRRVIAVEAPAAGRLRVATFLYHGWWATIDGAPLALEAGEAGVIEADVPAGRHVVEVRFGPTADRRAGALLSALAVAAIVAWGVWGWQGR